MSDPFFKNLELQIKETGTAFWACRSCVSFANTFGAKVNEKLKQMDKRVDSLQEKVEANTGGLEEVQEKVETVEKRMEKLEKKTEERETAEDDGMFEELRAREAIRRNLVVYGLEEPDQTIKEGKDRLEADKNECENIFNTIGAKARRTDIRFCRRLGERGEDARPLLLGMTSETIKCEILDRAKELQNTEYQHIGIGPDQTKKQKQAEIKLTEEANRLNREELTEQDKAKNLKWAVIGPRGEKRLVKVPDREREGTRGGPSTRGVRGRGRGTWTRGRGKRVRPEDAMEDDSERPPRTRTKQ
jgi:hypothetical protein